MKNLKDAKMTIAEVVDRDLPGAGPITEEIRKMNPGLCGTRSFYTDEEFEAYRKETEEMKLP